MTILSDILTPATGDAAVRAFKDHAVSAGWQVPTSSDGAVFGAGDKIINDSGAGSFDTPDSWLRLAMPGSTRELLFQRGPDSTQWRVLYSASGFTNDTDAAVDRVPIAADQVILWGAGTDAIPLYAVWLPADGTYRLLATADNATPRYLGGFTLPIGGGAQFTAVQVLPMRVGSFPGSGGNADTDPYLVHVDAHADACKVSRFARADPRYVAFDVGTGCPGAWRRLGLGGASFASCVPTGLTASYLTADKSAIGNAINANSGDELPLEMVCLFGDGASKGYMNDVRYVATALGTAPNGTHLTGGDGRYWVRIGDLWVPWTVTVPTI